ncbi:MAG: NYN domain-containing protein [Acidobacteriota bacterium]|nr:NYN domain-containing protein [Acidobacteriota bacterium]
MVPVGWDTYFERLGPLGLRLVLSGLLQPDDVEPLTGDEGAAQLGATDRAHRVADRLAEDSNLRGPLVAVLDRRAASAEPKPEEWDEKTVRERLAMMLRDPESSAAAVLHRLARMPRPPLAPAELRAAAEVVATTVLSEESGTKPKYLAKVASDRAGMRELQQQRKELEERVRQLEGNLTKTLERTADLEERLSRRLEEHKQMRAGEKETREDKLRLDRELQRLRKRIDDLNERRARERTGEVTTALRRLTTEQRKARSSVEKLRSVEHRRETAFRDQARELGRLNELIEKMLTIQDAQSRTAAAAQEAILRELAEARASQRNGEPEESESALRGGGRGRKAAGSNGTPRAGVFVDVQNMFYGAREKGARLDFEALLASTTSGRQLVRAVAYLVEAPEIDQRAFIHLLQMKAYEVKRKPLRIRPDRTMKGNWDLEMALDALSTAEHLDVVVLVTGDGDFVPLVRQLKLRGLRVEVYGFTKSSAPDLREAADRFFPITRRLLRPLKPRKRPRKESPGDEAAGGATARGADGGTAATPQPSESAPASS